MTSYKNVHSPIKIFYTVFIVIPFPIILVLKKSNLALLKIRNTQYQNKMSQWPGLVMVHAVVIFHTTKLLPKYLLNITRDQIAFNHFMSF